MISDGFTKVKISLVLRVVHICLNKETRDLELIVYLR